MPMPAKPDPIKHCIQCGAGMFRKRMSTSGRLEDRAVFLRRRYCDQKCMARAFIKIDPTLGALRFRARKEAIKKGSCEVCGETRQLAIHHMDENVRNNSPENTPTLCNWCHKTWHHYFGLAAVAKRT